MFSYIHKVKYYETDKMGITHHSNYVRFMEEARVEWMNEIGYSYKKCEDLGIMSPILEINCKYKVNTTFDDEIKINVSLVEYDGIKMKFKYEMFCKDKLVTTAESKHCFINSKGFPVRLKKDFPELDKILVENIEN